jgi:hypothetical protein
MARVNSSDILILNSTFTILSDGVLDIQRFARRSDTLNLNGSNYFRAVAVPTRCVNRCKRAGRDKGKWVVLETGNNV